MAKSQSLEFTLRTGSNKLFCVQFESESRERNLLMDVIYDGLPLDTVQIKQYNALLYNDIKEQMQATAENYWSKVHTKQTGNV